MGNASTKKSHKSNRRRIVPTSDADVGSSEDIQVDSVTRFDQQIINTIKKDLKETPELFVLNNMLMAVMFFENYQKEIEELSKKRYQKGGECISPDVLLENVNKNVLYRPLHGPKKTDCSETLIAKRMYIVNDVVEVLNSLENVPENLTKAAVRIEESSRKGYVKLRELEASYSPSSDEEIPIAKTEPTPSTSRSSTESESYGYTTITDMKTPKPIEIIKGLEKQGRGPKQPNIPPSCISYRKKPKSLSELELEDKEIENITEDDLYDTVSYINSKGFMGFFQNNIFPNGLGTNLGFEEYQVRLAKAIPGKIFCSFEEDDKRTLCEVIPSFKLHWPHKQTLQFIMKAQKNQDPRKRYMFPTQRMINEIKSLECVVVPKGYIRKKGEHADSDLEWEIQFPQAEMYLETFMSHAQAKCYLYLLALHKTYIDPKTSQLGLLAEHIRSFVLWECEANYSDWPEHRLGTKMMSLIKNLKTQVAKGDLRDFFVKEKNLLNNIPKKYLRHAQKVFHEVLEAPVMSFIKSLRNLRYTRGKHFYQPFDFEKLYKILLESGIKISNPHIMEFSPPNSKPRRFSVDPDMHIKQRKEAQKREQILKQRQEEKEKANLKPVEERKGSVDSIDMNWMCEREFDIHKTRALLKFFIENYIEIAEKCSHLSSIRQTLFYLKQARYLSRILKDESPSFQDDVNKYTEEIGRLENECQKRAVKEDAAEHIMRNGAVHFASTLDVSNSEDDERCSSEKVPKLIPTVVKPRKSVMFVDNH